MRRLIVAALALLVWIDLANAGDAPNVKRLHTRDGVEFGLLGERPASPAPTLFVMALDIDRTLADPYNKVGSILAEQGWLCVALDAPCHGKDNKEDVADGLAGWRLRVERGEDFVGEFNRRCKAVLDHLVAEGYTDPQRVAVAGTSRGGFLAFNLAATEPRVRAVAAFAPVTIVDSLLEFNGIAGDAGHAADKLRVTNVAKELAGRPVWMCIGNNDARVGTNHVIALSQRLVELSRAANLPAPVELRVTATPGHTVHPTAHAEAASFIAARVREANPERIADRACLFLDDRFITEQSGLTRTFHPGRPMPEPAIVADAWDNWPHLFGSVIFDPQEKLYRMWYSSIREGMFYAESRDGRTWTKPMLRLRDIDGSRENNLVMPGVSLPNVLLDPNEKDPAGRFKLFAWDHMYYNKEPKEDRADGHTLFRSPDGIRWEPAGKGIPGSLMAPQDRSEKFITPDTNQVIWDPVRERYLATFRTYPKRWAEGEFEAGRRRSIGVTTTKQITGPWQPIVTTLVADEEDDRAAVAAMRGVPAAGAKWAELYSMPLFTCGNHYIGLLSLIHVARDEKDSPVANAPGGGRLELAFSDDGLRWRRPPAPREALVAPSDAAADLHPTYAACSPPLEMGAEIWIYYAEANSSHPAKENPKSQIRAAAWRKEGFASLSTSGDSPGMLTTPPMFFTGTKLRLNVQPEMGGSARVGLLAADGSPIDGFDESACDPLGADETAATVTWRGQGDLSSLRDKPVRLRVTLHRARLYGFRFSS